VIPEARRRHLPFFSAWPGGVPPLAGLDADMPDAALPLPLPLPLAPLSAWPGGTLGAGVGASVVEACVTVDADVLELVPPVVAVASLAFPLPAAG
jgi:hypothetical protein